jgi:hypothetical protein
MTPAVLVSVLAAAATAVPVVPHSPTLFRSYTITVDNHSGCVLENDFWEVTRGWWWKQPPAVVERSQRATFTTVGDFPTSGSEGVANFTAWNCEAGDEDATGSAIWMHWSSADDGSRSFEVYSDVIGIIEKPASGPVQATTAGVDVCHVVFACPRPRG